MDSPFPTQPCGVGKAQAPRDRVRQETGHLPAQGSVWVCGWAHTGSSDCWDLPLCLGLREPWAETDQASRPCHPRKPSQAGRPASLPFKDRLCLPRVLGATRQLHSSPLPWDPSGARSERWLQQTVPRPAGQGWAWGRDGSAGCSGWARGEGLSALFVSGCLILRRSAPSP